MSRVHCMVTRTLFAGTTMKAKTKRFRRLIMNSASMITLYQIGHPIYFAITIKIQDKNIGIKGYFVYLQSKYPYFHICAA